MCGAGCASGGKAPQKAGNDSVGFLQCSPSVSAKYKHPGKIVPKKAK